MAYEKTQWENFVTPLDQHNMNKIEDGIANLDDTLDETRIRLQETIDDLDNVKEAVHQNASSIDTLEETVNQHIEDVTVLANTKVSKQNIDLLKDVNINVQGDQAFITKTTVNLNDDTLVGQQQNPTQIIADATENRSGLMSSSTVKAINKMREDINRIQAKQTRLLYTASTTPTAEEINTFVVNAGYVSPFDGVTVVVDDTYHVWHYYEDGVGWKDDGVDTVNQFSNNYAGIIKGSEEDGKIYANEDATGSVNGWDELKAQVEANTTDVGVARPLAEGLKNNTELIQHSTGSFFAGNVDNDSISNTSTNRIIIGNTAKGVTPGDVVIGSHAQNQSSTPLDSFANVVIGSSATTSNGPAVAIGYRAAARGGISIGSNVRGGGGLNHVLIGHNTLGGNLYTTAIGYNAKAYQDRSIAIGGGDSSGTNIAAKANGNDTIQLGIGENHIAKTLQIWEHQLLDGNTGLIPDARLSDNVLKAIAQTFTEEQKNQIKANLGIASSTFDGSYLTLTSKPLLKTTNVDSLVPQEAEEINAIVNLHKISKTGTLADAIQDENNRTVTDIEKTEWNNKLDINDLPKFVNKLYIKMANATALAGVLTLPIVSSSNFVVDWGDGTMTDYVEATTEISHTYSNASFEGWVYIYGNWQGLKFTSSSNTNKSTVNKVVYDMNITKLHDYAFSGCGSLYQFSCDNPSLDIGISAFESTKLRYIDLPKRLFTMQSYILSRVSTLIKIEIPEEVSVIYVGSFMHCTGLSEITLPDSIEVINTNAFYGCTKLKNIQLGRTSLSKLRSIGATAFSSATEAEYILKSTTPPSIYANTFHSSTKMFKVPSESLRAYKVAANWTAFADKIYPECGNYSETITIPVSNWDASTNTATVDAVGATSEDRNIITWNTSSSGVQVDNIYGLKCIAQGTMSLTFTCETIPTEDVEVSVQYMLTNY